MKILLLGEYSGVFNNLSKALKENGHKVSLISNGDGYKAFDSDIYIKYSYKKSKFRLIKKILNLYYLLLMYSGFQGTIQILKYIKIIKKLKNYDVVQLINPIFLTDFGSIVNIIVFIYLRKNNKKIFLCALGDDYFWIKYCLDKNFDYSMFDNLRLNNIKFYLSSLVYVYGFLYPFLNKYMVKHTNAIIPGLYDYYKAYNQFTNCTEIVPIIIPIKNSSSKKLIPKYPIKIFHGWQIGKELRKGNDVFDRAIKKVVKKYPNMIEYNIVQSIPYSEYVKTFDKSDIFIDQCFSQDKGVNALLGMSEGKVVFSGFESSVKEYYNINYEPLINALPNEEWIFKAIENLVVNIDLIAKYSLSAKKFIGEYHSSEYVIGKYLAIWKKN